MHLNIKHEFDKVQLQMLNFVGKASCDLQGYACEQERKIVRLSSCPESTFSKDTSHSDWYSLLPNAAWESINTFMANKKRFKQIV